ncbi:Protein HID1 [Dissostichus eleginoides]|uniref:Protein HID1 n=1 Tax=Dissostichus eleginoides TaxID=100907 RepID=A0AAD9FG61_DISEL|nr:Protein HID1 [Dissostichus eleginoides]
MAGRLLFVILICQNPYTSSTQAIFSPVTPGTPSPGPEKPSRQASQNEDSDIYHVYSTISEEPPHQP